ncbi:hypothetical protein GX50_00582 [[Emmonsia] crescens]|uniref:Uncharacterized protein n=1 Tax=[Emmonsia] crescens TaxID=73230 RepID=A0A2B7ZRA2_9EURO|nr:hypothetical protein GX50_00582 [Emmonsia crescens]
MHVADFNHDKRILTWGVDDTCALRCGTAREGKTKDIDAGDGKAYSLGLDVSQPVVRPRHGSNFD